MKRPQLLHPSKCAKNSVRYLEKYTSLLNYRNAVYGFFKLRLLTLRERIDLVVVRS